MLAIVHQLQRRRDCFLRMIPIGTDQRNKKPTPRPQMQPETALKMCLTGVGFSLSLEELRAAWNIAEDADRPYIEAFANNIKQAAA